MSTLTNQLRESLHDEIITAIGLPRSWLTRSVIRGLFQGVTDRLAYLAASFDQITKEEGLSAASEWALTHFCTGYQVHGIEHIPKSGPLLVASNHPGTYDALVLFANLAGHKIRCVASVIPFINLLPNVRKHILVAPRDDARERMLVLRSAIRHLQEGGTLVYFASGHRDPDPAIYPGAELMFNGWLNVFDTFFKFVEDLRVQPSIISGVVSMDWARHPITWVRRKQIDRQRLAEFGQVITQLRTPGKLMMKPRISIGPYFSADDLRQVVSSGLLFGAVLERGKALFQESSAYFGDFFG